MAAGRRIWPILVSAAAGIAILLALGAWQIHRLSWKLELLGQVAANQAAAPVGLSEALDRGAAGRNIEFLKITVEGRFFHDAEMRMLTVFDGGPGWEIVTPLVTTDGQAVLVDRGAVPDRNDLAVNRPDGPVTVTGFVRSHAGSQGIFAPDNDPAARRWYWWNPPAMLASSALPPGTKSSNLVLQVAPESGQSPWPRPAPPQANLRNNHLSYAITWFSLAGVLAVIAGLYVRGQMKKTIA